jgi:hypothetical protein
MERAERPGSDNGRPIEVVNELASRQYGLVSRAQALAAGCSTSVVSRRLATGTWQRALPGVYRLGGTHPTGRQSAMAACLWAGSGAVVSNLTAGVLWGIDGIDTTRVHVTVMRPDGLVSELVRVHRTKTLPPVDVTSFHGVPITTPARTLIDVAGDIDDEALLAAYSHGLRERHFTRRYLTWRLEQLGGRGRAGSRRLRALLVADADPAMESRLEVKVWRLLRHSGLPVPRRQHAVVVDSRRYRLDFAWPELRVAVEVEGRAVHGAHRIAKLRVAEQEGRRRAQFGRRGLRRSRSAQRPHV